jgi:sulfate adenylyltransferase subunit 2
MATHPHHLQQLEAESIEIIREGVAGARKPVMLYSIGKDSSVMLHLAQKAFYPGRIPFPVLHIDTTWKFQDMYAHRAKMETVLALDLLIYRNEEGLSKNITPFQHGSSYYTDVMKTDALKQALTHYGFDIIFGGARRDEEKSRAKERIFSHRTSQHGWDPKSQRAEFWTLYNTHTKDSESLRVFPLSNWTELSIWEYILQENISVVPLYLAKPRPVVNRNGSYILVDDHRYPLQPGETPEIKTVRFRTLGCYPLTAAVESTADTLEKVVEEVKTAHYSERQGRLIDHDQVGSMEKKKQEGYF